MSTSASIENAVAIVGAECRLPGASNLEEYWDLLISGKSAISKVPDDRLDRSLYFSKERVEGRSYSELSGVVPDRPFDIARNPIPPALIQASDSVHLTMLEVCADALRCAGLDPFGLPDMRTGVFIGHSGGSCRPGDIAFGTYSAEISQYLLSDEVCGDLSMEARRQIMDETIDLIRREVPKLDPQVGGNFAAHDVSVLVSRALQLDGPSLAIDAACASSMIAIAQAVFAIQTGEVDLAIAGGCSYSKWYGLVLFSDAQSISGTGSRPFDSSADGLISSDGYAALVLKSLPKALEDGDPILSVIRHLSVGSDGKGKSLWAPRREGQVATVLRAYSDEVPADSLQYIECHATSTQIGDATEIAALSDALKGRLPDNFRLPIGSVKGNIGHALECAGIAGMLKTVLALKHGVIPPQPNITEPNPAIAWDENPFYLPLKPEPWPGLNRFGVRRAAVNAFGIGGLNAHFVLDDRPEPARANNGRVVAKPLNSSSRGSVADAHVAVVGMGVIVPGAGSIEELRKLMESGQPALSRAGERWNADLYVRESGEPHYTTSDLGGFIHDYEFDWKKYRIPPKQIANANPLQFMLLDAAGQALADAGYDRKKFDRSRTAAIVGTVFGGDFACEMQMGLRLPHYQRFLRRTLEQRGLPGETIDAIVKRYGEYLLAKKPALRDETGSFTSSTLASRLTKTFDLMGGAWAVDSADASGLMAVRQGMTFLQTGQVDMVLCASGQRSMDVTIYETLGLLDVLARDAVSPAFDGSHTGFVPGEGAGVVLLKRLADAERDGDRIHCVIQHASLSFDEHNLESGCERNIRKVLGQGSSDPSQSLDLIESARVLTKDADDIELSAYSKTIRAGAHPVYLTSGTSQIGHLLGASGLIALIRASLQLERGTVSVPAGHTSPTARLTEPGSQFALPATAQPISPYGSAVANRALVSNICANGIVGHMMISTSPVKVDSTSAPDVAANQPASVSRAPTPYTVGRWGARSISELERQITAAIASGNSRQQTQVERFASDHDARLSIVARNPDEFQAKLKAVAGHVADPARRVVLMAKGINVGVPSRHGKVAVVFSGQGSQYPGMLRDWVEHNGAAQACVASINTELAALQLPSFEQLAWSDSSGLGTDVLATQLGVLTGDLVAWAVLQDAGLRPAVIAGHSYGEFPALVAAGAWSLHDALVATIERTRAVLIPQFNQAAMLSTSAGAETVGQLAEFRNGQCDIACINSPDQTIIAGPVTGLDGIAARLSEQGFVCRIIKVPMPYHSRLLADATAPFAAALQKISMVPPQVPFVACGSCRTLSNPDDIRSALAEQLTSPVLYQQLVETLISDGVGTIIESGPKQVLTRLNQQILRGQDYLTAAVDTKPVDPREQFLNLQALCECLEWEPVSQGTSVPGKLEIESVGDVRKVRNGSRRKVEMQRGQIIWTDATERRREKMRNAAHTPPRQIQPATIEPANVSESHVTGGGGRLNVQSRVVQTRVKVAAAETPAQTDDSAPSAVALAGNTWSVAEPHSGNGNGQGHGNGNGNGSGHGHGNGQGKPRSPGSSDFTKQRTLSAPVPVPSASPASGDSFADATWLRDKMEAFAVDFVVEQTGYPPDLVEIDAGLESDLGIDSIRKARLIGELSEEFDLTSMASAAADTTLDDFPTIGTIIDFFISVSSAGSSSGSLEPQSVQNVVPDHAQFSASPAESVDSATSTAMNVQDWERASGDIISRNDLADFAVAFVVEQTGYPEELVELTADLEADLGIDSIRKARLLAEIADHFELTDAAASAGEMSLDDFPTLMAVVEFFERASHEGGPSKSGPRPTTGVVPAVSNMTASPAVDPASTAAVAHPRVSESELAAFAVAFVIDETGYPEELVELDADLEADLGIDSIRKARLLGEVAEQFNFPSSLMTSSVTSLDDFPTLQAVVSFFVNVSGDTSRSPISTAQIGVAPTRQNEQHPETSALAEARTDFGSSTANGQVSSPPEIPVATVDAAAMIEFAVNYVIDQTGYPPELVELDADLEADLGIDSIRKAQLLGEIANNFDVAEAAASVTTRSLDDFPTLQSIIDFFVELSVSPAGSASASSASGGDFSQSTDTVWPAPGLVEPPRSVGDEAVTARTRRANVMQRYVLRAVATPDPQENRNGQFTPGCVLIVGDSPANNDIEKMLVRLGCQVESLGESDNVESCVDRLTQLWFRRPIDHVVLTGGFGSPDGIDWSQLRDRKLMLPYFVLQRLVQLRLEAKYTKKGFLIALTQLGGDFGIFGRVHNPVGGGLSGLLKGIRREFPEFYTKIIDTAEETAPEDAAQFVGNELASPDWATEVGYIEGIRHRIAMIPRPVHSLPTNGGNLAGTWIVTGGARGITARIAARLGKMPGVRLHLIGRSPAPELPPEWRGLNESETAELRKSVMRQAAAESRRPADAWAEVEKAIDLDCALARMRNAGVNLTYHSCDVTNRDLLARVLDEIRQSDGPVKGVLHAAGIEAAARYERKIPSSVEATVHTKIDGAQWLWQLTENDHLQFFVAFGSTSGRFGGLGQTDYSMSSDMLCRMCSAYRAERPDCRVVGIHWPPWDEVGMAARPESRFALEASGLKFLPVDEGIQHLIDELCAEDDATEVAIVDSVWDIPMDETDRLQRIHILAGNAAEEIRSASLISGILDSHGVTISLEARIPQGDSLRSISEKLADEATRVLSACARPASSLRSTSGLVSDIERQLSQSPNARVVCLQVELQNGAVSLVRIQPLVSGVGQNATSDVTINSQTHGTQSSSSSGPPDGNPLPISVRSSHRPLLRNAQLELHNDRLTATVRLDPLTHAFLSDHRISSVPILPAVTILELMGEAAELYCGNTLRPIGFREMTTHGGIRFPQDKTRNIVIKCESVDSTTVIVTLHETKDGEPKATGLVLLGELPDPEVLDVPPFAEIDDDKFTDFVYPLGAIMKHGPSLQSLKRLYSSRLQGWALLDPPGIPFTPSEENAEWLFDPALLDGAIYACGFDSWVWSNGRSEIPSSIDELRLTSRRLTSACRANFRFIEQDERSSRYDMVLYAPDGTPLMDMKGYRGIRVD